MQFTTSYFRAARSRIPLNEVLSVYFESVISWKSVRITCNSHCLSKIFAVSPFSNARDLEDSYRRLSRMTLLYR